MRNFAWQKNRSSEVSDKKGRKIWRENDGAAGA